MAAVQLSAALARSIAGADRAAGTPSAWTWAALMRRVTEIIESGSLPSDAWVGLVDEILEPLGPQRQGSRVTLSPAKTP